MTSPPIKLYALSTCSHCKAVKKLLRSQHKEFEAIDVDQLDTEQRKAVLEEVKQYNKRLSFPTTVIGDKVIVGNKAAQIKKAIRDD